MRKTIIKASLCTLAGVFTFEMIKEFFWPGLSKWGSHYITIGFVTLLVTAVIAYLLPRRERALRELHHEQSKQKDIIISEVHHRVKNNMAMAISLLSLKLHDDADPCDSDIRDTIAQLEGFLQIYELLVSSGTHDRINLRQYLGNLADKNKLYMSNRNIDVSLDLEDREWDSRDALHLGTILQELFINSFKHAFPENVPGSIHVTLRKKPEGLCLEYQDNGSAVIDADTLAHGYGMMIVETLVGQLGGVMRIRSGKGFLAELTFPRFA